MAKPPVEFDFTSGMDKINRHKVHYRVGYLVVNALFLALLFNVEESFLRVAGTDEYDWNQVVTFGLMVAASWVAFFVVQGTNPGYLSADMLHSLGPGSSDPGSSASLMAERDVSNEDGTRGDVELPEVRVHVAEPHTLDEAEDLQARRRAGLGGDEEEEKEEDGGEREEDLYEGRPQTAEYCEWCEFTPPIRSHHCRYCESCVSTYDHHCFCIGTCIGERNHCKFWWYLTFQLNCVWWAVSVCTSSFRYGGDGSVGGWIELNALALTGVVVLGSLLLFCLPLWGFHTFLAMTNMTGYECGKGPEALAYLRGTREFDLPFSNGLLNNLQNFCCVRDGFWHFLGVAWRPTLWKPPQRFDRNSEDIFESPWENKYWSCC